MPRFSTIQSISENRRLDAVLSTTRPARWHSVCKVAVQTSAGPQGARQQTSPTKGSRMKKAGPTIAAAMINRRRLLSAAGAVAGVYVAPGLAGFSGRAYAMDKVVHQ